MSPFLADTPLSIAMWLALEATLVVAAAALLPRGLTRSTA